MDRFLETERLILRTPSLNDVETIMEGRNSPFVLKYNLYCVATEEDIRYEIENIDCVLLILKQTAQVIGCIYIKEDFLRYRVHSYELAAWVKEEFAAHGYMTEAGITLMRHLFAAEGVKRLTARVFSENVASRGIMKKLGFRQEGYLPEASMNDSGKVFDLILYSIGKDEFEASYGL